MARQLRARRIGGTALQHRASQPITFCRQPITFCPRWYVDNLDEADAWYEEALPSPATQPIFDAIRRYGITCYLGYAEIAKILDTLNAAFNKALNSPAVKQQPAPPTS